MSLREAQKRDFDELERRRMTAAKLLNTMTAAGVGGGKDKAVENLARAMTLAGPESELGQQCAVEIEKNKKKGWFF